MTMTINRDSQQRNNCKRKEMTILQLNNTIAKMKSSLNELNSRFEMADEAISTL